MVTWNTCVSYYWITLTATNTIACCNSDRVAGSSLQASNHVATSLIKKGRSILSCSRAPPHQIALRIHSNFPRNRNTVYSCTSNDNRCFGRSWEEKNQNKSIKSMTLLQYYTRYTTSQSVLQSECEAIHGFSRYRKKSIKWC